MTLPMKAVRTFLRRYPSQLTSEESALASIAQGSTDTPPPSRLGRRFKITRSARDGRTVVTVAPGDGGTGTHVIYLHGGAYIHGIMGSHWSLIGELIRRTGATVTVPLYRLAPAATAAQEFPFLRDVYGDIRREAGGPVYLAGDSAGGGLALGLSIELRNRGSVLPEGVFLFSPWVDVTMSNPDIQEIAPLDPVLAVPGLVWAGKAWAGEQPATAPTISPLLDTLEGLPPLHIYQGGHDIFWCDAQRLADKARAAGTSCSLHLYPDAFHVFVGMPWLPESRDALSHATKVIKP